MYCPKVKGSKVPLSQSDDFLAKSEASIYSCFNTRLELAYPLQIPIRRHANQQLVVNILVDHKLRMTLEHSRIGSSSLKE